MGLIEEEDEFGLVRVSDFGQLFEEVGKHPQQEHRVNLRVLDEPCRVKDVDVAASIRIAREPI